MRKLIILTGIVALTLTSCEYEVMPVANFSADGTFVEPRQVISFYNHSSDYDYVEWNFGDGSFSSEVNPAHWYASPGVYTVSLTVFNGNGSNQRILYITVDYEDPYASFSTDYIDYEPGEVVSFVNNSSNAREYIWDFGDGITSNDINPTHYYKKEGIYTVSLSAINGDKVSVTEFDVSIYYTTLEVVVMEYYSGDLIVGINVTLYNSFNDWRDFINPIIEAPTDTDGAVVFKRMSTESYFIDAWSSNYNNESLGLEDVNFIKTAPLEHARHNVFEALVDYVPPSSHLKSAGNESKENRKRKMVVKEIKRSVKDTGKILQRVKKK